MLLIVYRRIVYITMCYSVMDIRRRLGQNVSRLRRERELSQEDFAFESGLHRTYISGIERGVRNPTVLVIQKLANALAVSPATLFM